MMGFAELALQVYARSGMRSPLKSPETTLSGLQPTFVVDVRKVVGDGWPYRAAPRASEAIKKRNGILSESFDFM
jgi:hypothetical protein